jgi:hypothetical protein
MRRRDQPDERTDIRRTDQHYSWRGVYDLCEVEADPDADPDPSDARTQEPLETPDPTGEGETESDAKVNS